jgi:hypothetical protein
MGKHTAAALARPPACRPYTRPVPASRIVILTALASEARAVRAALRGVAHAADVLVIGPGAAFLPAAGDLADASFIIVAGLAGALDPALRPGDTIIDGLPAGSALPLGARRGHIHTSAALVSTPADKSRLFASTGAAVVDMEHAVVQRTVSPVPVIGLRAVLDAAAETLPPFLATLVDTRGRSRPLAALAHLARHPTDAAVLLRLAGRSAAVLPELGRAVGEFVAQLHNGRYQSGE